MPEITEYDYYDATLAITIVTQRPEAAPSQLLVSATLHEEFAARVRKVLREFRQPLDVYLPYYAVNRIRPSGTARDIDRELNQDLLRQQFALGFSLTAAAQIADEIAVFAMERNIEKAVRDVFDLRPAAILRDLDLRKPIYRKTAAYGHFGRSEPGFTWEVVSRLDDFKSALGP